MTYQLIESTLFVFPVTAQPTQTSAMISLSQIVVITLHCALVFATSAPQYEPVATGTQADYGAQASYGGGGDYKQEEKHAYAPYGFGYNVDGSLANSVNCMQKGSNNHSVAPLATQMGMAANSGDTRKAQAHIRSLARTATRIKMELCDKLNT